MEKNGNENNIKEIKINEKQKEGDAFFASSAENTENSSEEENNQGKKNNLNYKNLISHPDKTEIEVLDNIKGDKFDFNFKIIVIGNSGVGKSCLTLKATKDIFQENFVSTMGFQFYSFHVKINQKVFKLQIWDTCGQEICKNKSKSIQTSNMGYMWSRNISFINNKFLPNSRLSNNSLFSNR